MHARRFSSSRHRTQTFDVESSVWPFTGTFAVSFLISFFSSMLIADCLILSSPGIDSDDVDISTSVLFEEFVSTDVSAACSRARISIILSELINYHIQFLLPIPDCSLARILFIATLGTIIFSFFPSIRSICFCRTIQATNKSQKSRKSSSEIENKKKFFDLFLKQ